MIFERVVENLRDNYDFFLNLVFSHMKITLISVFIAITVGITIGIFISEYKKISGIVISIVNVIYTIPSIALLGVLISFTGIGNTTAIIALTVYALLPIVRSTYVGITNIDENIVEASKAMGSTNFQVLYKIKLPLAFPVIFSGICNMVIMTIALAGIASFVGAGGLGVAIYRGITTNNQVLLLNGSMLIAILALFFDKLLGTVEMYVIKKNSKSNKRLRYITLGAIVILLSGVFGIGYMNKKNMIQIASKPTTEGYILAEITKKLIEDKTDLIVDVTHGVGGGTANLHPAILKGDFDLYQEYTGTAWQIVLKENNPYSESMFDELKSKYEKNYKITWRGMFGFNNTYGLGVQKEVAEKYNLKTYSDLAKYSKELIFGAEYDFFEREDGFNSLSKAYNLQFKKNVDMDNGLKYQALLDKQIDVMTVFTTDGQLSDPRIVVLEDDLNFYPSYRAGNVVRLDTLKKYPKLEEVFRTLEELIDEETMAKLNHSVEIENRKPEDVAKEFLQKRGLVGEK